MAVGAFFDKKHVCRHELWEKTLSLHQIAFPCMNAGLACMTSVLEQIASVGGAVGNHQEQTNRYKKRHKQQ
jgi:hypothetical protein